MSHSITRDVAARYATALAADATAEVLALLASSPRFQSPFTLWEEPAGVSAAYSARAAAFTHLNVRDLVVQEGRAILIWQADVSGERVEGCEVLSLSGAEIVSVDVYLRPAAVLPGVLAAMRAAWPR